MNKVVNIKKEKYDIYIGRPSKWGNPFSHKNGTMAKYKVDSREEAVHSYYLYITKGEGKWLLNHLDELKNKTLGCWCAPKLCHGDVLKQLMEQYEKIKNEQDYEKNI